VYLRFPKLLIIVLTSFAGAGAILAGFFLALGRISLGSFQFGEVGAILRDNWLWGLLYLAIAAMGFAFQWQTTQTFFLDADATSATGTGDAADVSPIGVSAIDAPISDLPLADA
jgi:hypothetical protein